MRATVSLALLTLMSAGAPRVGAQAAAPAVGDRVRLQVVALGVPSGAAGPTYRWTGRFVGSDGPALRFVDERGDSLLLAPDRVRGIDIWTGKRPAIGKGLATGALAGGLIGGAFLVAGSGGFFGGPARTFALGFEFGAVPGAVVGALVGTQPKDRWRKAILPAPAPVPAT